MRITQQEFNRRVSENLQIVLFLDEQIPKLDKHQWYTSYLSWARGGNGWNRYGIGGTYINAALAWYQHIHQPGSHEWRPPIIMKAVKAAAEEAAAARAAAEQQSQT